MKTLLLIYGACLTLASLQVERFGWRHAGAVHRVLHVLSFAGLAALAALALRQRRKVPLALLAAVALGAGIELAQHLVYHNPYEWDDLRDDTLGAAVAAAVFLARPAVRPALRPGVLPNVRPKGSQ